MREAQVGQRDRLIRLGLDSEAEIVFAIVREHRDDAGNVTYVQERTSTLTRRLEAFAALRERAKLYRSVLAITVTDLDRQLDEMSARVEGLIHQKAA